MQNGEQAIRLLNGLMYQREEVEQRTHSGDEIGMTMDKLPSPRSSNFLHYM